MKNTLNTELAPLSREFHRVWDEIYPDAGPCTTCEVGELVLDHLDESTLELVRPIIDTYPWRAVTFAVGDMVRN